MSRDGTAGPLILRVCLAKMQSVYESGLYFEVETTPAGLFSTEKVIYLSYKPYRRYFESAARDLRAHLSLHGVFLVAIRHKPGPGQFEGWFALFLHPRMGELHQHISLNIDRRARRKSMQIRPPIGQRQDCYRN